MKTMFAGVAAAALLATAAMAQEEPKAAIERTLAQVKMMGVQGSIMGKTVKGAPYSATEISETTQILGDGTRIHNESQVLVFRDSEGRLRRETPNEITIWDPVANATWVLNTKAQTARKLGMNFMFTTRTPGPEGLTVITTDVAPRLAAVKEEVHMVEARGAEAKLVEGKLKAEIEANTRAAGGGGTFSVAAGPSNTIINRTFTSRAKVSTEPLGKRSMEGVMAEGSKSVSVIEPGAIGNDRPIQTVSERWYSADLQIIMLTRLSDPRTGEEVFKVVNVNRAEPAPYLFQVPAGYQIEK